MSSLFSRNSEAFASEFQENIEDMFPISVWITTQLQTFNSVITINILFYTISLHDFNGKYRRNVSAVLHAQRYVQIFDHKIMNYLSQKG